MAILAAWLAGCKDHRGILAPGERALLPVLAQTKDQAVNAFNFVCGVFSASPALRGLVEGRNSDTLQLASGVDIVVRPASFRSARGATTIGVICDEIAWWRDETSANPDQEILRAVRPSLLTTKGPLIAISSPYSRRGELWKAYSKYFGKDSRILVAQAASWITHPDLDPAFIAEQYEDDPVAANAEFGANFRNDIDAFIQAEVVTDAVVCGRHELMPSPSSFKYHGFCDPSGGSQDSFTLSVAHGEGDIAVLDCIREFKPHFSPENVVAELAGVLRSYGPNEVTGDAYSGEFVRELFRDKGISYTVSRKSKSEIYIDLLPMLNSGRVALLDHPKMITQLCGLERRTTRGTGRDIVDHPPNSHDDLINAAAGALCLANLGPVPLNFYAPITGPSRSAVMTDFGSGLPAAIYGAGAGVKPGTYCPEAGGGGFDAQFGWSPNGRNNWVGTLQSLEKRLSDLGIELERTRARRLESQAELRRLSMLAERGDDKAKYAQEAVNKRIESDSTLIVILERESGEVRRQCDLARGQLASIARKTAESSAAPRDRLFEVIAPDGRRVRHRHESADALQKVLTSGYRVVAEVFGADIGDKGGLVDPIGQSTMKTLLAAHGDELVAFLAERGIKSVTEGAKANGCG